MHRPQKPEKIVKNQKNIPLLKPAQLLKTDKNWYKKS